MRASTSAESVQVTVPYNGFSSCGSLSAFQNGLRGIHESRFLPPVREGGGGIQGLTDAATAKVTRYAEDLHPLA